MTKNQLMHILLKSLGLKILGSASLSALNALPYGILYFLSQECFGATWPTPRFLLNFVCESVTLNG